MDASVALRFLLVEEWSDRAARVLEDFLAGAVDLKAPKLILYEVGNGLWRATRRGFLTVSEAVEKLRYFAKLKINSIELDEGAKEEVLRWSVKKGATFYDGIYVMASKLIGATLLTADDILYEKARGDVEVAHLRNYAIR